MCEHPHVPMDAIVRSEPWLNSQFRFVCTSDTALRDVVDVFNSYVCNYSVEELAMFWGTRKYLYWDTKKSVGEGFHRMSLLDSIDWGIALLHYQFDNEEALVYDFLNSMYKLLNKTENKKNCLEVVSPPTAGMKWFFDSVLAFCTSIEQVENARKNSQFPFDNCFNKRLLYLNEPNFEYSFEEKLLQLFAGDPMSENTKHKPFCQIKRTPVIVTGNVCKFKNEARWNHRMWRFRWKHAPLLKYCPGKPHPLMLWHLFVRYNIVEQLPCS
jgi:hypothetical protein